MAFSRPTLPQLRTRIAEDFSGRLLNGAPLRPASVLSVLAWVWAGACHLMYGFFAWLTRQAMPNTAADVFLEMWCAVWGVTRKPGAYAVGTVTVTGSDGALLPAGSALKGPGELSYYLPDDVALSGSTVNAPVSALNPGAQYNLEPGAVLTLVQPAAGVRSACPVVSMSGGADAESDDALRARMLLLIQKPPHGGAEADYVLWALEVAGVTRAWCLPLYAGVGTVGVTFVCDALADIIPTPERVAEVRAHILEVCPVTARPGLLVFAPEKLTVNISLQLNPNTAAVRDAVNKQLADLLVDAAPGQLIYLSHINAAISNAAGEEDHTLLTPSANITPAPHQLPVLGTVSYD